MQKILVELSTVDYLAHRLLNFWRVDSLFISKEFRVLFAECLF